MLIDCWAQLSQDTLTRAIDKLPKDWRWLSRSGVLMFNFVRSNCRPMCNSANDRCCFTVCWM